MTTHQYGTVEARIAKFKGAILRHAEPIEVLGITGDQHQIPKNMSDTVVFRRWLPYGATTADADSINNWDVDANAHLTQEGVTPDAETINAQDITVQVNQYACLYMYTDKVADLYEDNVPEAMKEQTGERMGLLREMIRYGALKGCTNKFYAGGSGRSTVDESISLPLLRRVARSIQGNRGKRITSVLGAGPDFNTAPVEAGYLVFTHTNMSSDIRDLPGFKETVAYGSGRQTVHMMELGACEEFRFIVSPELKSVPDSGALVGSTGLLSTTGTNIDVYPLIVVAKHAWADLALRGLSSFKIRHIPHTSEDKSDPLGQRGYMGAIFWSAAFVQNDGWMAVCECGASNLT